MLTVNDLPEGLKDSLGVDDSAEIRVVNESLINETYCLTSHDERFMLKRFLADKSTALSRRYLFTVQEKLAKLKIAPKPLYFCEKTRFYVEQWISPSLTPITSLSEIEGIKVLADALATVHGLPLTTASIDLPLQWAHYLDVAKLDTSDFRARRTKELVFLATASVNSASDRVFCHNDLAMNHILNYEQLTIIDWEYCSTGNRYFDIASTIAINQLRTEQRKLLLSYYAKSVGISEEEVQEGVLRHEPLVTLTYQLWFAAITEHMKQIQ